MRIYGDFSRRKHRRNNECVTWALVTHRTKRIRHDENLPTHRFFPRLLGGAVGDHDAAVVGRRAARSGPCGRRSRCCTAAAPAAPAAAPALTNAELAARLADVEAYVTNGQPKSPTLATTSGPGPQRLDDDLVGAGAVHDAAGPGAVLRRPRAPEEHPVGHGAVPRLRRAWSPSCGGWSATAWCSARAALGSFLGGTKFAMLNGVTPRPTATTPTGSRRTCSRCTS